MCEQGLSGSPLDHRILRSPLLFPNVKRVPGVHPWNQIIWVKQTTATYHIQVIELSLSLLQLTKCEWNNVKQSRLPVSIHQVQSHVCDEETCIVKFALKAVTWSTHAHQPKKKKKKPYPKITTFCSIITEYYISKLMFNVTFLRASWH